jgi:hypothetical protein
MLSTSKLKLSFSQVILAKNEFWRENFVKLRRGNAGEQQRWLLLGPPPCLQADGPKLWRHIFSKVSSSAGLRNNTVFSLTKNLLFSIHSEQSFGDTFSPKCLILLA